MVGNTILGALSGERLVDWGIEVKDLVQRLVSGMEKSKATPICPPLPLARAVAPSREEGVSYLGDPPKLQCGVRGRGRSGQPGKSG